MLVRAFLVLNLLLIVSDGANILSVLPSSSKSHFIYPNTLLLELAASGHKVTVMSPYPVEDPPENYTSIDISDMKKMFEGRMLKDNVEMNLISKFKVLYSNTLLMTNFTLKHPEMKKLLSSNEKFDLIILDLFLTDALLGLSTVFNCPIVALSANGPHSWVNNVMGSPRLTSYVPHMYSDFISRTNLGKRLENEFFYFIEKILMKFYHLPAQEELFKQVFSKSNQTFAEVRKNSVAIALVNSHFSVTFPKPFLPNTIEVEGMQTNEAELKPLPSDIREFIEKSEHGVIYFSLGGNVKASQIDDEKKNDLIKALSSLKQNTIWKYDADSLIVDPKKIMVRKWLPQYEILGHNNTKMFITHAGLLSVTEAIYFAKPVIAVPIFGEQPQNAKKVANEKYRIHIDYLNFTGESLTWAVNEILSSPIYSQSMNEASKRFRDKPLTALETGKFWVEYVLHHKVSNVQSASLRLNFIDLQNLDVYVIIFLIFMLLSLIPAYFVKKLIIAFNSKFKSKSEKSKIN